MKPVGIRAVATLEGESPLQPATIAPLIGATPEAVARWNGRQEIRTSHQSATELGAGAARSCLEREGVGIEQVDAIIWCTGSGASNGRGELHVQHLLDAKHAFAVEVGTTCSEMVSALWMAHGMVASGSVERLLVVSGDQYQNSSRTLGLSPDIYQPVFSDVGSAALIESSERAQLIGFGAASIGRYWNVLEKPELLGAAAGKGENVPSLMQAFLDQIPINRLALARCLKHAGVTADQLDHIVLSREGPEIIERVTRHLRLPVAKVVMAESGSTHSGTSDTLMALDLLMQSGRAKQGQYVLIGTRTVAIMRFCVLRI